jgi:FAD/FMN-containing dehydrogenase
MEIPPVELELMKKIKKVFDPDNILNPGKIFP